MGDPALLASKLREETEELIQALGNVDGGDDRIEDSTEPAGEQAREQGREQATEANEVIHEAADLLYFTLVAAASRGVGVGALRQELAQRSLRVRRRPMAAKPEGEDRGEDQREDRGGDR